MRTRSTDVCFMDVGDLAWKSTLWEGGRRGPVAEGERRVEAGAFLVDSESTKLEETRRVSGSGGWCFLGQRLRAHADKPPQREWPRSCPRRQSGAAVSLAQGCPPRRMVRRPGIEPTTSLFAWRSEWRHRVIRSWLAPPETHYLRCAVLGGLQGRGARDRGIVAGKCLERAVSRA